MVYEISGPMFFAAANDYFDFADKKNKKVLIIRMRNVPAMYISGLETLEQIYTQ